MNGIVLRILAITTCFSYAIYMYRVVHVNMLVYDFSFLILHVRLDSLQCIDLVLFMYHVKNVSFACSRVELESELIYYVSVTLLNSSTFNCDVIPM